MSPILYVLVFLTAILTFEGFYFLIQDRFGVRRRAADRLERLARDLWSPRTVERVGSDATSLRPSDEEADPIGRLIAGLPGMRRISLALYRSGSSLTPRRFLLVTVLATLGGALAGALFFPGRGFPLAALGIVPWLQLQRKQRRRMLAFERQLPDALDLCVRALRAGHSLTTALKMVGEELPEPIGLEFTQLAREISLGMSTKDALDNLVYRVISEDLPFFVTAISIQQETGSNLAEILSNLAQVIRERFKVLGKVRALTAMGRASANILAIWPAVMIGSIFAANPDYVKPLWETQAGHTMILMSLAMIVVGYIVCRKMATIRV